MRLFFAAQKGGNCIACWCLLVLTHPCSWLRQTVWQTGGDHDNVQVSVGQEAAELQQQGPLQCLLVHSCKRDTNQLSNAACLCNNVLTSNHESL